MEFVVRFNEDLIPHLDTMRRELAPAASPPTYSVEYIATGCPVPLVHPSESSRHI